MYACRSPYTPNPPCFVLPKEGSGCAVDSWPIFGGIPVSYKIAERFHKRIDKESLGK
jgi:hypothetical protein